MGWPVPFLAISLLLSAVTTGAQSNSSLPLRTLTTAHEVHSLSTKEALRGYPLHLHAVVTFYDKFIDKRHIALFVKDATGSIFISVPFGSVGDLPAGTLVDVRGVTSSGDYAPIIANAEVKPLGMSHIPATAPRVTRKGLATSEEDGQWIEIEGVVHSVSEIEHDISLVVATADGNVVATVPREAGKTYSGLVDAQVLVHGNVAPVFNGNRQLVGARLLVPNLSAIRIVGPPRRDPFQLAVRRIDTLLKYDPDAAMPHRVHLRGEVTLQWLGSSICIRDASAGLCAKTTQHTPIMLGQIADVAGFVAAGSSGPMLTDASYSWAGPGSPVLAEPLTAEEALLGKHDSELVKIDGVLIGRDLAAAGTRLMLASGKFIFAVVLPQGLARPGGYTWKNGSTLQVTGICSLENETESEVQGSGLAAPKSFRILLRSPRDVIILQSPSWWTPGHGLLVVTFVLALTLAALGWVVVLRKRVDQQTSVIRKSEERFRYMAQHDALTGLPTRLLLHDRLNASLARTKRYGSRLALLMLDLDNFKLVNDSLGHDAGDQTLIISAQRIRAAVRNTDTVARMGGDEFIVLLTDLHDPHEAEMIAAKIVVALSAPIILGERHVQISVSVGVCDATGEEDNAETLLKGVDTAMYHAKAQGRNCFQLFTSDMARETAEKLRLRAGLGLALELEELELYYQPMVSFKSGELTGFEALLRWNSTGMGLVMPGDFISLAEESGLIVPIGEWVLREACRQIGLLEKQLNQKFMLGVNLSPRQFQQPDLPQMIARALADYGRAPDCVEFEITESMLMTDSPKIQGSLEQLRDLGVQLAIDDFGLGFSSLSYITRFSIDRIKIDRSFVQNCLTDQSNVAVIRAIIAMAHGLAIQVVGEGVETAEQFHFLQQEGCDTAQGYYLSRPVPAAKLAALLDSIEQTTRIHARI